MKVRNKFLLIILSVFTLLSVVIFVYYNYTQKRNLKQLEYNSSVLNSLIKTSINAYNRSYEGLATDYSFWDDMVDYVNGKKNKKWEVENLEVLFKSFNINAVWVYDKNKKIKYFVNNLKNDSSFIDLKFSDFIWKDFNENRGIKFHSKIENKYCFIFGKTIHNSYDFDRKSEPSGYFLIAKSIDSEILNYYSSICNCNLQFIDNAILPNSYSMKNATFTSSYPFNNQNGELLGSLRAVKKSPFLLKLYSQNIYFITFLAIFGFLILFVIYLGFNHLVNKPLYLFSMAIIDNSEEKIEKLSKNNNEFGKLGFLFKEFILQKKLLENEIALRKQTNESLSELNIMYKSLFEDSSVAICFSKDQKLLNVNKAFLSLFNCNSFDEISKFDIIDLIHEDDKPKMYNRYYKLEKGLPIPENYDIRIFCKDSEIKIVNVKSNILVLNNEKYNLTILQDITQMKNFENELYIEKAYFESLYEKSPEAIAILDDKGVIAKINNSFTKLFGYTVEEAIGKTTSELIEPEELYGEVFSLVSKIKSGETIYYDTIRVSKTNDYIDVSIIGTPIELGSNKFGIYAIYRDNRDRVLYNKEIKKKGELFNALAYAQQCLLNLKDEYNSLLQYLNIIGTALQIGRIRIFELIDNNEDSKFNLITEWKNIDFIINSSTDQSDLMKLFIKWKDDFKTLKIIDNQKINQIGADIKIFIKHGIKAFAAVPIYVRNSYKGFICFEDFENDSKWTETELSILNISATSIGNFMDQLIYENEILDAREKAEEANRLKTNFISNMSHELRTPLNGILGFTELLKDDLINEEHISMLNIINVSSLRLLNTLNSIIDFSLLSSSKIFINKTVVDIDEVINDKVGIYKIDIERKNIKFTYNSKDKIKILTDIDYFSRIIAALIDNAIKFTKKGEIVVESSIIHNEIGEKFAKISVIDTGIGIAKEHFNLIFEPFLQVSDGLSREYEGNGIGLTICKRYIELLGGKINLESELGNGSIFTIILPDVFSHSDKTDSNIRFDKIKPLLLLVEDEVSSREFANIILSGKYSLHTAINADSAIMKANEYKYDAILMDISLGMGKNGVEIAKIINSISGYENVPIAAVTANAMIEQMEYYLKNGFTHYISKPYTKVAMLNLIEQMLSNIEY